MLKVRDDIWFISHRTRYDHLDQHPALVFCITHMQQGLPTEGEKRDLPHCRVSK